MITPFKWLNKVQHYKVKQSQQPDMAPRGVNYSLAIVAVCAAVGFISVIMAGLESSADGG